MEFLIQLNPTQPNQTSFLRVAYFLEAARNSVLPEKISSSAPFHTNSVYLQMAKDTGAREPVANNGSTPFQHSRLIGNASHGKLLTSTNRGQTSE
ncbi:hypothetical protein YC2023_028489 [Brassica napus]